MVTPACSKAVATCLAWCAGTAISKPSSPVYPVPATTHSTPNKLTVATRNRFTLAASGDNVATRSRARGPCTAKIARVLVVSSPPMMARTRSVLDAFGITSNTSGLNHHTMMSSLTPPCSLHECVYCARPGAILRRSFVSSRCNRSNASAPDTRTVPRCETSNIAASVRHAMCSAPSSAGVCPAGSGHSRLGPRCTPSQAMHI